MGCGNESEYKWFMLITKMAAMPIYGKNLLKCSSLEPKG